MSGICGLVRIDGRPAGEADLRPVLSGLAARGPDRLALLTAGPVALGHALLATTPEAATEPMPLRHAPTGCIITADARLDKRTELLEQLEPDRASRTVGDGELILAAYLRWGVDCPRHLTGDFAFAIWDPRHRRLLCARDKVGMRQLIYCHLPGRLFAFATDIDALLANPDVPGRLNEARIADFVEDLEAFDLSSTFYLDLHRLPPAHSLVIENGEPRLSRYWQLDPPPLLRCRSDADYAEAFLAVFEEAVRARLRSADRVGSMLSGGMDSGSVSAVAARLLHRSGLPPLKTYSAIDTDPTCPESRAIRASLAIPHIDPQVTSLGEPEAFLEDVTQLTRDSIEPFDASMAMVRAVYLAAQRDGIKVVLDGVAGDTTLPTGNMIAHHLAAGRPAKAWREARAQERFWNGQIKARAEFFRAAKRVVMPRRLREWRERTWLETRFDANFAESIINPDLAARLDIPERRRANYRHVQLGHGCDQTLQAQRMLHPYVIVARERYDRVAGAMGIEPRDPFLDPRVLDFCLSLPVEQIHDNGWPKLILRRAMRGALPDSVLWKTGRHHVGWHFVNLVASRQADVTDDHLVEKLKQYVRLPESGDQHLPHRSKKWLALENRAQYLAWWLARVRSTWE